MILIPDIGRGIVDMSYFAQTDKALAELKNGNPRGLESVIRFLEGDEYRFGSGYLKERAWRVLKQAELTESQKQRLRNVALQYLHRRVRGEFSYMCKYIALAATDEFKRQVEQLMVSAEPSVKRRAILLSAYLQGPTEGEAARRQLHWDRWSSD